MNSRPGAMPVRRPMLATAGSSTAVAAMLFMNADSTPATVMIATVSVISRSPTSAWMRLPMASATPVCWRAALRMKIASMVITAGDWKPLKAFSMGT